MLYLTRKENQVVRLCYRGKTLARIVARNFRPSSISLGIDALPEIAILREEARKKTKINAD